MVTRALERGATQLVALRRFFHDGWGDRDVIERFRALARHVPAVEPVEMRWGRPVEGKRAVVLDGEFTSPVVELPEQCRTAHMRLVVPTGGAERVVVLMAAWNEHGYGVRAQLARRLVGRGLATAMLENPYYGSRIPGGDGHPMAAVSDFFVMGRAAALEGQSLLDTLARNGAPGIPASAALGVSGFSMGGNVAAFVAVMSPVPVAAAPLAASYSPAPVFLDGAIRAGIDWEALDDGGGDPEERLRAALADYSVLRLPVPDHTRHAVIVAGREDAYVPAEAAERLHRHWPGSELRWTREGHASLRFLRRPTLIRAILDSFDRKEAAGA